MEQINFPFVLLVCSLTNTRFFIVPEDVAMLLTTIYGFAPPIHKGSDHRVGFGFRFGEHADLQVTYELGPQLTTKPLTSIEYPNRRTRRPLIDLLTRAGILKDASYNYKIVHEKPK